MFNVPVHDGFSESVNKAEFDWFPSHFHWHHVLLDSTTRSMARHKRYVVSFGPGTSSMFILFYFNSIY
jgi:hypothetical protein